MKKRIWNKVMILINIALIIICILRLSGIIYYSPKVSLVVLIISLVLFMLNIWKNRRIIFK